MGGRLGYACPPLAPGPQGAAGPAQGHGSRRKIREGGEGLMGWGAARGLKCGLGGLRVGSGAIGWGHEGGSGGQEGEGGRSCRL